ncbi:MAG: ATP-binding SpoIIE family protein phosphatase [Armatimonadota bacterium]
MAAETNEHHNAINYGEQLRTQLQNRSVLLFVTLASIGDAVIMTDRDGDITFLNPMAETLTGWKLEEAAGLPIEEVFNLVNEITGNPVQNPVRQALSKITKVHLPPDTMLIRKDGTHLPVDDSGAPIIGIEDEILGTVLVFRDITERKQAEEMINYRSELDRMVARISTAFITSPVTDVDSGINEALKSISIFTSADRAYVFLYDKNETSMICTHEWSADGIKPLKGIVIPTSAMRYWTSMIHDRRHILLLDSGDISNQALSERLNWDNSDVKSLAATPMFKEDKVLGLIGIEFIREARSIPEEMVNMLYLVGNVFASTMDRRDAQRRLDAAREREVEIGSRIQQTLLLSPPPTASPDAEIAAITIPSRGIDGDFYDFLLHPNRNLDIIFGDVMGKGVPAALLSAGTKTEFLRSLSHLLVSSPRGRIPQPADIVNSVHCVLTPQLLNLDSFVTLTYARLDPQVKKIVVVDCGNTRLLRCRWDDRKIDVLSGFNMPLGFSPSEVYEEAEYDYSAGDLFLLYSDGVTEARNHSGEMFGKERIQNLLAEKYQLSPQMIVESIRDTVTSFVGSRAFADDLTCVCFKIPVEYSDVSSSVSEFEVSSSLSELAVIRAFLRGFCDRQFECNMDQKDMNMLELAISEVASNIIRHAYHGRTDQRIWIRASREGNMLKVRLTHTGEAYKSSDTIPSPSIEDLKEGGFGLFIISHTVNSVEYGQDIDGRQYVELRKYLRPIGE